MASHSPQRNRKVPGLVQNLPPREMSPSPTFRDRQRAAKTQTNPLTSTVMQMYQTQAQSRPSQQPSPPLSNGSHQSRRSPPSTSSQPLPGPLISPEHLTPPLAPAPPQHTHSLPNIHAHNPQMGYPRPMNRSQHPQFLTTFNENWSVSHDLMSQIPDPQHVATGTAGLAYAGGAVSSSVAYSRGKDPNTDDRVDRPSPKDLDGGQTNANQPSRRQGRSDRDREPRESPKTRDRPAQQQVQPTSPSAAFNQTHTPERRPSPPSTYHAPMSTAVTAGGGGGGENPSTYPQYMRETYPRISTTPPHLRRSSNAQPPDATSATRATPPASAKLSATHTPPLQAIKTRSPDRSLPVQEEIDEYAAPNTEGGSRDNRETWQAGGDHIHDDDQDAHEDDLGRLGSPTPSSDLHPEGHSSRFDGRGVLDNRADHRDDDDETLIEGTDHRPQDNSRSSEDDSFTPRSPSTTLPDETPDRAYTQNTGKRSSIRVKSRAGVTDQLGMRGFEAVYEQVKATTQPPMAAAAATRPPEADHHSRRQAQAYQQPSPYTRSEQGYAQYQPPPAGFEGFFDDPTSAYLRAFLQSPRPNAPIPPTPQTHTAAPSPSPLISGMQSIPPYSPIPPAGSPYPFPFSHVRRQHAYPSGLSSPYDPNHPAAIQEQLALQMQMYALNNHRAAAMSDSSTLSPSSTPFQPTGYNPWAFLNANRRVQQQQQQQQGGGDALMSLQSSPSHEPLPLPMGPPASVRRRNRSMDLRKQAAMGGGKGKGGSLVPPRVESTQPRETSPEPSSSGEDTAGDGPGGYEGSWVNGIVHDDDNAEWVDEEGGEGDDLLELEYHPSFVSSVEKRRRRWETKWEALVEAFEALDRQTDATLVLFASPSHTTKLHSVTSRSLRRDATLGRSPMMSHMRSAFNQLATRRRKARARKSSLADRLMLTPGELAMDGSEHSESSREEELRRALEAALGSLGVLGGIYEQRESRWREEMRRVSEERERVELLLQQALGVGLMNGRGVGENDGSTGRAL